MAHTERGVLVLDSRRYEGAMPGDFAVWLAGHEGAGGVALLILSCVGD